MKGRKALITLLVLVIAWINVLMIALVALLWEALR
jgi:hypothetical protein